MVNSCVTMGLGYIGHIIGCTISRDIYFIPRNNPMRSTWVHRGRCGVSRLEQSYEKRERERCRMQDLPKHSRVERCGMGHVAASYGLEQ